MEPSLTNRNHISGRVAVGEGWYREQDLHITPDTVHFPYFPEAVQTSRGFRLQKRNSYFPLMKKILSNQIPQLPQD